MAKDNETMIPIPPENLGVKVDPVMEEIKKLRDELESEKKKTEILQASVSKGKQVEAKAKLEADKSQRAHVKVDINGKPIVAWKTISNEVVTNPASGETVGENLQLQFQYADGTESPIGMFTRLSKLNNLAYIRLKEKRFPKTVTLWDGEVRPGVEVWVAEWEDPKYQELYGDLEIANTYLN